MSRPLLLALVMVLAATAAAQTYTVSGGALAYTPLSAATATPITIVGVGSASVGISPTGFSAGLQGATVTSFQVSEFGHARFAASGITNKAHNDFVSDLTIAPCWGPVVEGASGAIQYEIQGSVLVIEWLECEWNPGASTGPAVTFQLRLDSTTGEIEFRYAPLSGGNPGTLGIGGVCVTGPQGSSSAIPLSFGELAGFVGSDGSLQAWPADSFIRFTPAGGSPPEITVTLSNSTHPTPQPDVQLQITSPRSLSSMNFLIAVDDADGDNVTLDADVYSTTSVPSNLVDAEFQSASAATPYTLLPTTGTFEDGNITVFFLLADDGTSNSVLLFRIWSYKTPKQKSGLEEDADQIKNIYCSVSPGAGGPLVPIAILLAALWLRRRRILRNS